MKSPMIQNQALYPDEEKACYGDMEVLRSAAGYYVGTLYDDADMGKVPGTRDSYEYYGTEDAAAACLELIEAGIVETRDHA